MRPLLLPLSLCLLLLCCGSDGEQFYIGDRVIKLLTEKGSWDQMSIACRREGGHMIKIDSADLMHDLVNILKNNVWDKANYWIGATNVGHGSVFRWHDGSKVKMGTPFWGIHRGGQEPNGNLETCVFMDKSNFMYLADALCSDNFGVLCELPG
nr:perlucin-like protein [Penaeus vannamei]